jgi:DNA-binding protein HU-beta
VTRAEIIKSVPADTAEIKILGEGHKSMATGKAVKKMSKTQLTAELAEATGTNKKAAGQFLDTLTDIAYRETKKNGEFTVPGIGKLVKAHRKARKGRNPATGETIKIAAKTVVKFRVAKAAKDSVLSGAKK